MRHRHRRKPPGTATPSAYRHRASRRLYLVFVGASAARVAQIRTLLPGAVCASHREVLAAVREAIARPPAAVARPASVLAGYSGTPLPRKLGIKPGMVVRLLNAPAGLEGVCDVDLEALDVELPRGFGRRGGGGRPIGRGRPSGLRTRLKPPRTRETPGS